MAHSDRFFAVTVLDGRLHVHGIPDWGPWDSANVKWLSGDEIPATDQKVRMRKELAAVLNTSMTSMPSKTIWVHKALLANIQRPWKFGSNTVEAFGRNILLFKNLRQRMVGAHIQESQSLQATIDEWEESVETYHEELRRDPHSGFLAPMETTLSMIHHLETRLESLGSEEAFGREMAFVYLIATLDGFVAGWSLDMGLASEGKLPQGDAGTIRDMCRRLGVTVDFPKDFDDTLTEMRARRNVLAHRGGIADRWYCRQTNQPLILGTRLSIDNDYLNKSEQFVTNLVWERLIPRLPQIPPPITRARPRRRTPRLGKGHRRT